MKKITKILILLTIISAFAVGKSNAQEIYVNARLGRPSHYEANERLHPRRPSPRHVWVSEGWRVSGRAYAYRPGYWALPPHPRAYWRKGHWVKRNERSGYRWVPGHWS